MIDAYCSFSHYVDHVAPIWTALPDKLRGNFYVPNRIAERPQHYGIEPVIGTPPYSPRRGLQASRTAPQAVIVAGAVDLVFARSTVVVLVEHGIGQTYGDNNPSNPGGTDRETVSLFLCTNDRVASKNLAAYPDTPAVVVGMPKLDYLATVHQRSDLPVVSFHWDNRQCSESRWAWPYYHRAIEQIAKDMRIGGHSHPRVWRRISNWYSSHRIIPIQTFEGVVARASVYICDNSSTMYEAAALGIPVVVLNDPLYRKDKEHGLRFWEYGDVGINVNKPEELRPAIEKSIYYPHRVRAETISNDLFPYRGHSITKAVQAVVDFCK